MPSHAEIVDVVWFFFFLLYWSWNPPLFLLRPGECRPMAFTYTFTYHIRTSPHHRHMLVLFTFELSPCLDLGYLSLSLNPITHLVSSLSDSHHISITSVVHRYLPPMSFHFFWNFNEETDFPHMNCNYFPSLHACHVPLGLKIHLTESFHLHEPPKGHCNPLPGWTFIMAACTSDVSHHTHAQWAAYNTLHPCISPPLDRKSVV